MLDSNLPYLRCTLLEVARNSNFQSIHCQNRDVDSSILIKIKKFVTSDKFKQAQNRENFFNNWLMTHPSEVIEGGKIGRVRRISHIISLQSFLSACFNEYNEQTEKRADNNILLDLIIQKKLEALDDTVKANQIIIYELEKIIYNDKFDQVGNKEIFFYYNHLIEQLEAKDLSERVNSHVYSFFKLLADEAIKLALSEIAKETRSL